VDAQNGDMQDIGRLKQRHCRLKMKPWKVSGPVVSDAHHFDEEQDLDPDQEEK
jgi:hypothetical protein